MTRNIVRYGLLALLAVSGAITALAAGEGEEAMAATGSAPIIADNHGKNAWDLSEWQQVTGQTLTFTQAPCWTPWTCRRWSNGFPTTRWSCFPPAR